MSHFIRQPYSLELNAHLRRSLTNIWQSIHNILLYRFLEKNFFSIPMYLLSSENQTPTLTACKPLVSGLRHTYFNTLWQSPLIQRLNGLIILEVVKISVCMTPWVEFSYLVLDTHTYLNLNVEFATWPLMSKGILSSCLWLTSNSAESIKLTMLSRYWSLTDVSYPRRPMRW